GEAVEVARFSDAIREEPSLGQRALDGGGRLTRWEEALRYLARLAEDQPLLVVIDEMPYLLDAAPGFATAVQAVWDEVRLVGRSRLMLVLTGSARRVIQGVLSGSGPLYGRPDVRLEVEPLGLGGARQFLPELDGESLVEAYAACGGYPQHLLGWDAAEPTGVNLRRLAGTSSGILLEGGAQILHEEVAASAGYERILAALARGANKHSTLSSEAGQRIEQPLNLLTRVGLVRAEVPVGASKGARPLYRIDDPYLAFWFTVLYEGRGFVEATGAARIAENPRWKTHVASVFEDLARGHARSLAESGALHAEQVGRWWSQRGAQMEIDVAGWADGAMQFIGEVKWRALGEQDLDRLVASLRTRAERVGGGGSKPLLLAWAKGFPPDIPDDLQCFTVADMLAPKSP
ncbi:MAG: ATP-binding protein, partial [Iamia sp.]